VVYEFTQRETSVLSHVINWGRVTIRNARIGRVVNGSGSRGHRC
jgi:hypothetical protein